MQARKLLYATTFKTNPSRQVVILTYLCEVDKGEVLLSSEHSDYLWANKNQLKEFLFSDIISDLEKHNVFEILNLE